MFSIRKQVAPMLRNILDQVDEQTPSVRDFVSSAGVVGDPEKITAYVAVRQVFDTPLDLLSLAMIIQEGAQELTRSGGSISTEEMKALETAAKGIVTAVLYGNLDKNAGLKSNQA